MNKDDLIKRIEQEVDEKIRKIFWFVLGILSVFAIGYMVGGGYI